MGGASPYRSRFIGLLAYGQNGAGAENSQGADPGEKFFGFVNLANTCYVNSVLQSLYFCAPFRRTIVRYLNEDDDSKNETLLASLAELFAQIECQKRTVGCLTPRRFLSRLRKANDLYCSSEHQDAHEFMQFLLNDIVENIQKKIIREREHEQERYRQQTHPQDDAAGYAAKHDEAEHEEPRTWVHDIFQGCLVNQTKCLSCENVTVRRENFLDLSVDIEQHTSIAACLRSFESTEWLRAGDKFFCDCCCSLQEAEKRLRIYQLPSVLTLHLKRFKYVERLGRCCRLPYRVVFPLELRVVEHRPPAKNSRARAGRNGLAVDGVPPADGDVVGDQPASRLFELRSVVVHIGRDAGRGHYITVVRAGDRCVLLDDDIVRVVEPEVLRSFYGTAGGAPVSSQGQRGGGNANDYAGNNAGWGENDNVSSDRIPNHSPNVPLYERATEGTCCGYLLFYEAVDTIPGRDSNGTVDVSAAADWISEDHNLSDSESEGDPAANRDGAGQDRTHPNACDDIELTQAFEQRCIPRGLGVRQPVAATTSPSSAGAASISGERAPQGGGYGGAFAWAAASGEGAAAQSNSNHGGHGVLTLGSVVPSAGSPGVRGPGGGEL